MKIVILFFSLFSLLVLIGASSSQSIQKFMSSDLSVGEKIKLLEHGDIELNEQNSQNLIQYLQTCETQLLFPLTKYICSSEFCNTMEQGKQFKDQAKNILKARILDFKNDPNLTFDVLSYVCDPPELLVLDEKIFKAKFDEETVNASISKLKENTTILVKVLEHLSDKHKEVLVTRLINAGEMAEYFVANSFLIKNADFNRSLVQILFSKEENIQIALLDFLSDFAPILSENRDIISAIAEISVSGNGNVRKRAHAILSNLFPFAISNDSPQNFNWKAWWDMNKAEPYKELGEDILINKNVNPKIRLEAFKKYGNILSFKEKTNFDKFRNIILDRSDDIDIRSQALNYLLLFSEKNPTDKTYFNSVSDLIVNIFDDYSPEREEFCKRCLDALSPQFIDSIQVKKSLWQMLSSNKIDDSMKISICLALTHSLNNRKKNAKAVLSYYSQQNDKPAEQRLKIRNILFMMLDPKTLKKYSKWGEKELSSLSNWQGIISSMPDDPPEEEGK